MMSKKFIYVFDTDARNKLLSQNHKLLKADEEQNIYVFENRGTYTFSITDTAEFSFILSDTLTF